MIEEVSLKMFYNWNFQDDNLCKVNSYKIKSLRLSNFFGWKFLKKQKYLLKIKTFYWATKYQHKIANLNFFIWRKEKVFKSITILQKLS